MRLGTKGYSRRSGFREIKKSTVYVSGLPVAIDNRADLYALGVILYECLTGKRAFHGEGITDTLAKILEAEPRDGKARTTLKTKSKLSKDSKTGFL